MEFVLDAENFIDQLAYKQEKENLLSTDIKEFKNTIELEFGKVDFHEIDLEVCSILISSYNLKHKLILKNTIKESFIEMHFNLGGPIVIGENKKENKKITIDSMMHNIIGVGKNVSGFVDYTQGHFFKTFDVHLNNKFFERWYGYNKVLDTFIDNYKSKSTSLLYPYNMPITAQIQDVISQIINCNFKGFTRKVYLESKVQELFCLQIEQSHLCFDFKEYQKTKISTEDIEKINFAKKYIEDHLNQKISIVELSKISSINQQKLKSGFKELFGTTVFHYSQFCKMNKAREMLLKNIPIVEVYNNVGYSNQSSFSYAFKTFFGFSPKKIK